MEIIMKFATIAALFLLTTSAFAACPKQLKDAFSSYKKESVISSQTYKTFSLAIKHYRAEAQTNDISIETAATYIKGNRVSGYLVEVTDGGDESTVAYIFNAKKKLVVAYLYNQSPLTFWFCGKDDVQESEETVGVPRT
jgi:hypothetical protein